MNHTLRTVLITIAAMLALLLLAGLAWVLLAGGGLRGGGIPSGNASTASNPALNVRYHYDSRVFTPAPYNGHAEFPLQLDAAGGGGAPAFSFFGKRLGGLGRLLGKEPAPMLYDFAGQQSDSMFVDNYGLEQAAAPKYEDARIDGRLALHQVLAYRMGQDKQWPEFFPSAMDQAQEACIEGWTLFTKDDLFYFYAISPVPLTPSQRAACVALLNSLQFNAIRDAGPVSSEPAPEPGATAESDEQADEGGTIIMRDKPAEDTPDSGDQPAAPPTP
jgi:hypothetical protein